MEDDELTRRGQLIILELSAEGLETPDIARMTLGICITITCRQSTMPLEHLLSVVAETWRRVEASKGPPS